MVDTRETPTPSNTPGNRIGEGEYADAVAAQTVALWGVSVLGISNLFGTNDLVGEVTPPIVTPYTAGMAFWLTPSANNTDAMTLDLGQGAEDFVRQDGDPFEEDDIEADVTYLVLYTGSEFRVQNLQGGATDGAVGITDVQTFTSSGTWNKPNTGTVALIRCWGAGGSGGRAGAGDTGGGGGGGAFVERLMNLTALGSTVAVTIGAGGTAVTVDNTSGTVGGNTTFGAHVTAFGGGGGAGASASNSGGGGGGQLGVGATGGTNGGAGGLPQPLLSFTANVGGGDTVITITQGAGGLSTTQTGQSNTSGGGGGGFGVALAGGFKGGDSVLGGGGGGGGSETGAGTPTGGSSIWGGGGGGGAGTPGAGGASLFGGNGGAGAAGANVAASGTQPGGGGGGSVTGNSGAGGAGQCIVMVW